MESVRESGKKLIKGKGKCACFLLNEQIWSKSEHDLKPLVDAWEVSKHQLSCEMSDSDIVSTFLGGLEEAVSHPFRISQINEKINSQLNGEDGELLTNGASNVLCVFVDRGTFFFAAVSYHAHFTGGRWRKSIYRPGDGIERGWPAGTMVFRNRTLTT